MLSSLAKTHSQGFRISCSGPIISDSYIFGTLSSFVIFGHTIDRIDSYNRGPAVASATPRKFGI